MTWRKSTYSANGGGECVEVADNARNVLIRDTKEDPGAARTTLTVTSGAWRAFTGSLR